MLFHCRMWCYAIGVEAVVLRSWCVVWCTVCQLVSNCNTNCLSTATVVARMCLSVTLYIHCRPSCIGLKSNSKHTRYLQSD